VYKQQVRPLREGRASNSSFILHKCLNQADFLVKAELKAE